MEFENEITVELDTNLEKTKEYLEKLNFKIKEEYIVKDIYMVKKDIKETSNYLDMLKNCVLIRSIITDNEEINLITYKYKEYNENKEIIKQAKANCKVYNVQDAKRILECIGYVELIRINDSLIVYSNGEDEFVLQNVNGKHIYLEIEEKCNYINKVYKSIDEMKEVIKKYNILVKSEDYFVKKAEIELIEKYGKKEK